MAEALAVIKVEADASGVKAGISDAKSALQSLREAAKDAGESLNSGSERFLKGLGAQVTAMERRNATFGQGKAGLASYDAAQLGVSGTAATMVARLKASEDAFKAQVAAADGATKSFGKVRNEMGLTAGELSNSLRGVPAQFTDIVVSLASGQRPLTVLLQQGGQLKDMFGGVGNAFKAIGGYVLGLINPLTIAAAAAAALAYAFYKGSQETKALNDALILTGGYAGVTAGQIDSMAKAVSSTVGTQGAAAAAMTQLAASGKIAGSSFESITRAALAFEKATGQAVEETVKQFISLADEPTKASAKLNETLHYLNTTTYERIAALERQGQQEQAAALAQDTLANAMKARADKVIENLGYMEKAFNAIALGAKRAWDDILGVGRADVGDALLQKLRNTLGTRLQQVQDAKSRGAKPEEIAVLEAEVNATNLQILALQKKGQAEEEIAKTQREQGVLQQAGIEASKRLQAQEDQFASKRVKMAKELREFEQDIAKLRITSPNSPLLDPAKIAETRAGIEKKYKEDAAPKFRDEAATKMLEKLKEQEAVLKSQLAAETPLLESEKERVRFTELITNLKGKTLTDDQRSLLAAQARIKTQLDHNVAVEQQVNFEKKIADIQKKSDDDRRRFLESTASLNSAMAASAAGRKEQYDSKLEVFGKGSQALEEARTRQGTIKEYAAYYKTLEDAARKSGDVIGDYQSAEYRAEVELIRAKLDEELALNDDYYANLKEKQGDWVSGATQALANYHDKTLDVAKASEQAFTNAFKSMEDAIVEFAKTGKLNIASLVNSILADLLRIQIQKQITGPLSSALGNLFGGAPNQGGINGGAILPDLLRGGQSIGANMARAASVSTGASRAQSVEPMRVTVNNHSGGQVSTNQIGPAELEVIVSAAVGRVDKNIASGTGSTASAMKSRGLNLSGNLPRRA